MKEIYQMEPGGTADILWYSYFASANKDYDQITNWKISSSDESIVSVEQTGKNTCTITALNQDLPPLPSRRRPIHPLYLLPRFM